MPGDPLAFTVTVPDGGWTGFGGWAISPPGGAAAPSGSGLAFLHGPPVAGTPCGPDASQPATRSVEDVVARLSAYPGGQLSGLTDTTLAGYPGKRLDLQLPASLPCQHPYVFGEPQGIWAQGPSNHWRVWVLDVQGSPAVIVLMDYPGTSASDLAVAQAIVDSVRISPSSPRPASPSSAP
jgi:hypothetical protein